MGFLGVLCLHDIYMFTHLRFFCRQELTDHTDEVIVQNEVLDGMFTFYDSTRATLNVYQVHFCTSVH